MDAVETELRIHRSLKQSIENINTGRDMTQEV
jgi:hypothetical protein